jgi:hypothetical protein
MISIDASDTRNARGANSWLVAVLAAALIVGFAVPLKTNAQTAYWVCSWGGGSTPISSSGPSATSTGLKQNCETRCQQAGGSGHTCVAQSSQAEVQAYWERQRDALLKIKAAQTEAAAAKVKAAEAAAAAKKALEDKKKAEGMSSGNVSLPQAISATTPQTLIGQVINVAVGSVGVIALVMFIWGGVQMMTATGNPEKFRKGKGTMVWASIGLALVFASYAIVNTIVTALGQS